MVFQFFSFCIQVKGKKRSYYCFFFFFAIGFLFFSQTKKRKGRGILLCSMLMATMMVVLFGDGMNATTTQDKQVEKNTRFLLFHL
jgi:hypothetical protein